MLNIGTIFRALTGIGRTGARAATGISLLKIGSKCRDVTGVTVRALLISIASLSARSACRQAQSFTATRPTVGDHRSRGDPAQ